MKRKLYAAMAVSVFGVLAVGPAHAGFLFGDETKGVTITNNESDLNIRVRLQERLDYGDIVKSRDGKSYESQSDLYLRRIRLEMGGHILTKTIAYSLILTGDKWDDQGDKGNEIGVQYANVKWLADDAFVLTVGKEKLPYSRVSLTSSSKQLLIERPFSTEAAKKLFGESEPYYQPKISAGGRLAEGIFAYEVAVADGWQNEEDLSSTIAVLKSNPLYVARVELSPPGWTEKGKSDAYLGKGQHLTLGVSLAKQSGIEYKATAFEQDRTLLGLDISGHYMGFTGQFEYISWEIDSTDPAVATVKPRGWYAQAGYFIDGLNLEPVARYEVYDQDSEAADMEQKITTLGVNWYGKGHSFKVGANWVHEKFDTDATGWLDNDDSKDTYQVQAQMYF